MCLEDGERGQPIANFGKDISYAIVNQSSNPQLTLVFGNGTRSADGFPFTGMLRVICDESDTGRVPMVTNIT
jgi:hypothetical protein